MTDNPPDPSPIEVLYRDAHVLAVSKPAGWLSQGWKGGEISLEDRLRRQIAPDDPASLYLGPIHRLDRPVSGVILWALTPKAARRLSAQFAAREIHKCYWALVEGMPETIPSHWLDWLCEEDTGLGRVQVCAPGTPRARQAATRARRLDSDQARLPDGCTWLELHPETGRTHQLRIQSSSRGWPILGDRLYRASRPFGTQGQIALHALHITFRHPVLNRPLTISAPVPASWSTLGVHLPPGPRHHTS